MTPQPSYTIPREAVVQRGADGQLTVLLDGEPFPYALAADSPVASRMTVGETPALVLTIPVLSLRMEDTYGAGALLDPTHGHDPAEFADLDDQPGTGEDQGAFGVVEDDDGWVRGRCADDCTLKALGGGEFTCDAASASCTADLP